MKPETTTKPKGHGDQPVRTRREAAEFSRLVEVAELPAKGVELSIRAEPTECAALARRGGLVAVESLAADFRLRKAEASKVEVKGTLRARVVQTCVISLEPFESDIESEIEAEFAGDLAPDLVPARFRNERAGSSPMRNAELEAPDPIIDGRIDLGALAAEFLMLALDPYPRKPGVSFDATGCRASEAETVSPFAALRTPRGPAREND